MDLKLTKDAKELMVAAYHVYLKRRKEGMSKADAKFIQADEIQRDYFPNVSRMDYMETVSELIRTLGPANCFADLSGNFTLPDSTIVYMENRFKNGLKDTASFLAQFIP